jgi:hypothetical protein
MSIVVANLYLGGIRTLPAKADPPLVINSDGMPAGTVPLECLESIAGRNLEV